MKRELRFGKRRRAGETVQPPSAALCSDAAEKSAEETGSEGAGTYEKHRAKVTLSDVMCL